MFLMDIMKKINISMKIITKLMMKKYLMIYIILTIHQINKNTKKLLKMRLILVFLNFKSVKTICWTTNMIKICLLMIKYLLNFIQYIKLMLKNPLVTMNLFKIKLNRKFSNRMKNIKNIQKMMIKFLKEKYSQIINS